MAPSLLLTVNHTEFLCSRAKIKLAIHKVMV